MKFILKITLFLALIGLSTPKARATHCMGGEITWKCVGSHTYVFQLNFYRDCNGFEINTNYETIQVWGHPTLTSFKVNFIQRIDISPQCTAANGVVPYACGTGVGGGNGEGAVEKAIYRSDPITITGTPPSDGWKFTYQNFSRSMGLTNIINPTNYGITVVATMYANPISGANCNGDSPTFLQDPYIVTCAGSQYMYNPHAVDPNLDSLHFSWGNPLDYFPTGAFNPPTNPGYVPYHNGYSYDNPTPDQSFNPNNIPATIDSHNGSIQFTSFTTGNFAIKVKVDAYRDGQKVATIIREMEVIVQNCNAANTAPVVTPPFAGGTSFDTTVYAGDAVDFDLSASDLENLQDGTPQSVTISSSGLMYGTGYTNSSAGCNTPDCATLNAATVTGSQSANLHFNWQTNCNHLKGPDGTAENEMPYIFVFKVKDDYCPAPKVNYYTVTIHVKNKDVLPAPKIKCITTAANGDVILHWDPISDPSGNFNGYKIYGVNQGLYGTIATINTGSYTINAGTITNPPEDFYIATLSGCGGVTERHSDTLSNISLDVSNPADGTAVLDWNNPAPAPLSSFGNYYLIYKEYPAGTWTKIDSVPYGTTHYLDTITVCQSQLNYKIVLPSTSCDFVSNIDGDVFEDQIVPNMPDITNVTIDTASGNTTINWDVNHQLDTYGYVIYKADGNGNIEPIDTVWGRNNTSFTTYYDPNANAYQYSVAAFDSCYTNNIPPTFHTSAKADPHTTMFLSSTIDICNRLLNLNWSKYIGFDTINTYRIYAKINQSNWQKLDETSNNTYSFNISVGDRIIVAIQAISNNGYDSFSNVDTLQIVGSSGPSMSYLSVVTVQNNKAVIKHRISLDGGIQSVKLERYDPQTQSYQQIDKKNVGNQTEIIFTDDEAEVDRRSYKYRTEIIDTCGNSLGYSNTGQTIYLHSITDEVNEVNTLQWTSYKRFLGNVNHYEVYRSISGHFGNSPIAILPYNIRTYTDSVLTFGNSDDGKICYKVVAQEGSNPYGFSEKSVSNTACSVIQPTIYIPNAFTVGGKNPVFKPITRERKTTDYLFTIYNRYGNVVFSTKDPNKGWNGEIKGSHHIAAEGVYIYRLSLRNGNNKEIIKFGHVTLLNYNDVNY